MLLQAKGVALGSSHCYYAAGGGHLEALQWLRSHGCAWDGQILEATIYINRLDIFRWSIGNGCPLHREACRELAVEYERTAFVELLDSLE